MQPPHTINGLHVPSLQLFLWGVCFSDDEQSQQHSVCSVFANIDSIPGKIANEIIIKASIVVSSFTNTKI